MSLIYILVALIYCDEILTDRGVHYTAACGRSGDWLDAETKDSDQSGAQREGDRDECKKIVQEERTRKSRRVSVSVLNNQPFMSLGS